MLTMGSKDKSKRRKHVHGFDKHASGHGSEAAMETLGGSDHDIETPSQFLGEFMDDHEHKIVRMLSLIHISEPTRPS